MNQKRAVQPRVNFHCLLGVNSGPVNQEPWGCAWRGGHSRSWRYYLLSGLLMRCSVWKQARDLLSAWLLRPPQETGWLVMCVRWWPFASLAPRLFCHLLLVTDWVEEELLILLDCSAWWVSGSRYTSPTKLPQWTSLRKAEGLSRSCV